MAAVVGDFVATPINSGFGGYDTWIISEPSVAAAAAAEFSNLQ